MDASQPPRALLHHSIRHEFARALSAYYKKFPGELDNPHLEDGTKAMLALMEQVLNCVDQYEISDLPDKGPK